MDPIVNLVIFAGLALASIVLSVLAVTCKSLLRAATYLLLVLICTAGFYLLLNYHFLAAVQISVYAGGVVILFIFAIFLTTNKDEVLTKHTTRKYIRGAVAAIGGMALVGYVLWKNMLYTPVENQTMIGDQEMKMQSIGDALMGTEKYQYLLPFEVLSLLLLAVIIGGIVIARKESNEK
ncbi:MAG: NADH-quinone oxidoreductase subunit J [Candidatus Symbiothrix sp.]|jgi:NADH-quinone oxidoreductase subunit J|nr:NADH-quinone oxidoreductase subunit J [Candidatus Symbiothrix sp.]